MACPLGCRDGKGEVSRVERRGVWIHRTRCPMRAVKCEYCSVSVKACGMNGHLKVCGEFPIPCPNECSEEFLVKRKDKSIHLSQECPLQETECPYSQYGCEVKVQRRNLEQHEKEDMHKHMKLMVKMVNTVQSKVITLQEEKEATHSLVKNMQNKIVKLEKENEVFRNSIARGSFEWQISGIQKKISDNISTYSVPFYIGLYKFQGFVQWNTEYYLGVFLYILKGEWDDTLKWPIKYRCSIILINQFDAQYNHESHHEITDETLKMCPDCFRKPITERNNCFGLSKFIPLVDLSRNYSKDDKITLKISVELILNI